MKTLLAILTLVVMTSSLAFCDGTAFNPTETLTADFYCTVIAPLHWTHLTPVDLPVAIKGQIRPDLAVDAVQFTLTGEVGKGVAITGDVPTIVPNDGLAITGSYVGADALTMVTGGLLVKYHVTAIDASAPTVGTGSHTITVGVSAVYTGL
jgi:hypothetical protein